MTGGDGEEEQTTRGGLTGTTPDARRPSDGVAEHTFLPGELVASRFRIVRRIGAGGMGEVYAARDLLLGEEVALKTVRRGTGVSAAAVDGLRREVVVARRVNHPGICRVFELLRHQPDPEAEGGVLFLTMELLSGENLDDRLQREGPPPRETAVRIAEQVAEVLEALHQAGVVHGDLKPSNVFLVPTPAGERVVLTDFGLAETVVRSVTSVSDVLGTPAFMAPEVRQGSGPSKPADVYALGALIHVLVSGRPPADGHAVEEVPPEWREIVEACVRASAEDRPQSVVALLEDRFERAGGAVEPRGRATAVVFCLPGRRGRSSGEPTPAETRFRRLFVSRLGSGRRLRVVVAESDGRPAAPAAAPRTVLLKVTTEPEGELLGVEIELSEPAGGAASLVFRDRGQAADPGDLAERLASNVERWLYAAPRASGGSPPGRGRRRGAEAAYEAAVEHLRRHEPEEARHALLDSLRSGADARSYEALARATLLLGDSREAELYAQRAIDLAAGETRDDVLSLEALRFEIAGEWGAAARIHQALWAVRQTDERRGRHLALALARGGKGREALAVVEELRGRAGGGGEPASLDLVEAEALERAGDLLGALAAARRAAARGRREGLPGLTADARLFQGVLLRRLGRFRRAGWALTSAAHRFEQQERAAEAADALRRLVEVQRYLPELTPSLDMAHRALQLSSHVGHRAGMAASLSQLGVLKFVDGDFKGAEDHLVEALHHSRAIGDLSGVAQALGNLALVDYDRGRLRRSSSRHGQARQMYQELGNRWAAAKERASIAAVDLSLGRPASAHRELEAVAAELRALGAHTDAATVDCIAVEAQLERGEAWSGRSRLARAVRLGRRADSEYLVRIGCLVAGSVELQLGRFGAADRSLARAAGEMPDSHHLTTLVRRIDLELVRGRLESAAAVAEALHDQAERNGARDLVAMVRGRMAEVRLARGGNDAVPLARQALEDVKEMEDVLEVLRVQLRCGDVLARCGMDDEGVELLRSVLASARSKGLVLLRLETELRLGRVELAGDRADLGRHRLRVTAAEARSRSLNLLADQARCELREPMDPRPRSRDLRRTGAGTQ